MEAREPYHSITGQDSSDDTCFSNAGRPPVESTYQPVKKSCKRNIKVERSVKTAAARSFPTAFETPSYDLDGKDTRLNQSQVAKNRKSNSLSSRSLCCTEEPGTPPHIALDNEARRSHSTAAMLTAQNNLALSACVRPEAETTTKASSKHREAFNVDKRRFALPVKRARHQHDVGASEHEDYNNGNCTSVKPLPRDELEISRRRRPSIAWEVQPTWRLPRERSSERFFIIETDSALEGSPALRQMSVEQGLEVVPEPVRTLIWKQISRVATFLLRIGLQLWGTGISRKRLRVAAVVISAVAAPTCVSVMSSAGTNSLVITGAVTAIIAAGKFLFDALAG